MMHPQHSDSNKTIPWKLYLVLTAESLLAFWLATFCVGMFFLHHDANWRFTAIILGILYAIVIIICAKRIYQKVTIAAFMLIIPIAPLLALIIVVTLIPVLENFL